MGSVHSEQINEGKGTHETFDYITFSDFDMVEKLIRNRQKLDAAYSYREMSEDGAAAMIFNEQVLATYASLDALIREARLTQAQRIVLS